MPSKSPLWSSRTSVVSTVRTLAVVRLLSMNDISPKMAPLPSSASSTSTSAPGISINTDPDNMTNMESFDSPMSKNTCFSGTVYLRPCPQRRSSSSTLSPSNNTHCFKA